MAAFERALELTRNRFRATNRYRGGVVTYLEVIAAQSAAFFDNQRTAVTLLARRLSSSVLLIKALGGGWSASALPVVDAGSN